MRDRKRLSPEGARVTGGTGAVQVEKRQSLDKNDGERSRKGAKKGTRLIVSSYPQESAMYASSEDVRAQV